ncbi:MAG: YjgP/YjgQ family permease [Deltaproteobacteria bacterium]|nr:YjgP/YjgQ family permease [Deltaproteobacteria bacterium]
MYRISLYIVSQILPWQVLALFGMILAFLTTQLLRVAPVFAGAGAGVLDLAGALGLLLVPVAGWALTPAFVIAVFAAAGRMSADGELTALDASGLSRRRLATGPVALAVCMSVLSAWLWLDAAPRSQAALRATAMRLAGRALGGRIEPGQFTSPLPGITILADAREPDGVFKGVFLEDARDKESQTQFVAKSARITTDGQGVFKAHLGQGSAFYSSNHHKVRPMAISFRDLTLEVPVGIELERRLDFLPRLFAVSTPSLLAPPPPGVGLNEWRFALWRRVAGPLGFLVVALVATMLAFGTDWRRRGVAVAVAAVLFLTFHLLHRFAEVLMQTGILDAPIAAMLPALTVSTGLVVLMIKRQ